MLCRDLRLGIAALFLGWAGPAATPAFGQETPPAALPPAAPQQPLPLARVVMFSSSVGFFEHRGEIDGNRQIEFAFKTTDINDLLKSLVVRDRGGGLVTTVNYGSPEPLARTLRSLAVDLTEAPTLAEILQQLRGHRVRVQTTAEVEGVVVGVENRSLAVGDKEMQVQVLNLRTDAGLRSVRLDQIELTRFVEPEIDRQFQEGLDLIASQYASDEKRVKLDFRGAGKRAVSVGYIQEAPVWKTSYRLVLDEKEQPFLQGWAIVENTTAQDWRDVQLTLVSGRPISFLMELAEPLFMARPLVTPEQHASLRPRVYDQDLAAREREFAEAGDLASRGGMGGMGGMMGGMGGAFGGGGEGRESRPFVTSVVPVVDSDMDLREGVAAAASAGDVGELFRYVIKQPVTLGRNESAMLPIVNSAVQGEKVAIYNPAVHAKHPLAGLRLTNTTDLHLLQGPITLFDGGEYAGDARIEDIPPGSTRLVSYALDLETEVSVAEQPEQQVLVALAIRRGGLWLKHEVTRQSRYTLKNSSTKAKKLLLERPVDANWKLAEPMPLETTRDMHRLAVDAEPGKTATVDVVEERQLVETAALASLDPAQLQVYVRLPAASPALREALNKAILAKSDVAIAEADRARLEGRLRDLEAEQGRIRTNLQATSSLRIDDVNDENRASRQNLLKRYLDRLSSLETELETERTALAALRKDEADKSESLGKLLESLVAE